MPWRGLATGTLHDQELAEALARRYGEAENWHRPIESFATDLGLDPYKIKLRPEPYMTSTEGKYGEFRPGAGVIRYDSEIPPEGQAATLMHELGHAADMVTDRAVPNSSRRLHHRDLLSFDQQMPEIMDSQWELERGIPPEPKMLEMYPWLKNVTPESSQSLQTPWSGLSKMPPEIWDILSQRDHYLNQEK